MTGEPAEDGIFCCGYGACGNFGKCIDKRYKNVYDKNVLRVRFVQTFS